MRILFAVAIISISSGLPVLAQSHPSGAIPAGRPAAPHSGSGATKVAPGVHVPPAIASGGFATVEHGSSHSPAQLSGQTFSRPISTFSRPDSTFSRPDSLLSRSFTATPQMVIRPDGNGGFRAFVRPGSGAHPEQLPGRVTGGPFYSGYRFQNGGSHYGSFQQGAQGYGYPFGWGAGPNSVIVINSDGQAYWGDGSGDGSYGGPMWAAGPMEGNGPEQSASPPAPPMTEGNGFAGPQGMPVLILPPPRREELVVVDFPPGARVLR
jgi:hypothetical protein